MKGQLNVKTPAEYCVAERYVDGLPKANIGKTCVRFRKLGDLEEKVLVALIKETAKAA